MKDIELKIIFLHDLAYLTEEKAMTLDQLGLRYIAKSFKENAYWVVRVLDYSQREKKLFCKIISYRTGETEFSHLQLMLSSKLKDLEIISFKSIDTNGLLRTMKERAEIKFSNDETSNNTIQNESQLPLMTLQRLFIEETFYVPLKKVRFIDGGVSFHKKFKKYSTEIEITIPNNDIREEFDAVKEYFSNVLRTKRIWVDVHIEIVNNEVVKKTAFSPEIEKVDKGLIENVKYEFLKHSTKRKTLIEPDRNLFTLDEYLGSLTDQKIKTKTFHESEKELIEDVLSITNTKHYNHLRYLSKKHLHNIMKLRVIRKPFSFIFLVEGANNYHLIWETLDTSEATYIWHVTKEINELKQTVKEVEDIINRIKLQGKTIYIHSTNDPFQRIYHDYSDQVNGFLKWKTELESILT